MSSNNIYYVYVYADPTTNEPFYVGKGKNYRSTSHLTKSSLRQRSAKNAKIKSILEQGLSPVISLHAEHLTELEALTVEAQLIIQYGRRDIGTGILCNHTNGGEGFGIDNVITDDERHARSERRRHYNLVNNPSKDPIVRAARSANQTGMKSPMDGKHHTDQSKQLMSIIKKSSPKICCEFCKKNIYVVQYQYHIPRCSKNPNREENTVAVIKEQALAASQKASSKVVCECCNQTVSLSAYKKFHGINCKPRMVVNGQQFVTLKDAAMTLNIPSQTLADYLKGRRQTFNDRVWEAHYI